MSLFGGVTNKGKFQKSLPRDKRTVFRLRTSAVDQAVNDTYFDEGPSNLAVTGFGTGVRGQGSFSPWSSPLGDWAMQLAGWPGEALHPYIVAATTLASGTGDFTWECFLMRTHNNGFNTVASLSANGGVVGRMTTGGMTGMYVSYSGPGAWTAMKVGRWCHFAFVRKDGIVRMYLNGIKISEGTAQQTNSLTFAAGNAYLGDYNANSNQDWCGYMSNMRITIGEAVYLGESFTPPNSGLTVGANTKFLGFCGPAMIDYSGNGNTFVYGAILPKMVPMGPFGHNDLDGFDIGGAPGSFYSGGVNGNYVSAAATAGHAFGTGDFTVEFWTYLHAMSNSGVLAAAGNNTAATTAWAITQGSTSANGGVRVVLSNGSAYTIIESTTGAQLRPFSWVHVVVCRQGGTLRMFLNGIQVYSAANATNIVYNAAPLGVMATGPSGTNTSNGYIANLRVSNIARYTAAFTPPVAPVTSDANTIVLLNFNNPAVYDDRRGTGIFLAGNAKVVADATSPGGGHCLVLDGTGDYAQVLTPYSNWHHGGDGDFTIEMYVNFANASASNFCLFDTRRYRLERSTANKLVWIWFDGYATTPADINRLTSSAVFNTTNTWHHVAIVRINNTLRMFINGVLDIQINESDALSDSNLNSSLVFLGAKINNTLGLNGKLKDFNVVRYAKYASNFTPAERLA